MSNEDTRLEFKHQYEDDMINEICISVTIERSLGEFYYLFMSFSYFYQALEIFDI